MSRRVLFRLNAGDIYGLGHFSRCYALAQFIYNKADMVFYIYTTSNNELVQKLNHEKFTIKFLNVNNENIFFDDIKSSDVVILDGYHFNENYIKHIKSLCHKLIVFDDFEANVKNVDAIINPFVENITNKQGNIKYFIGYENFLLRNEFLKPVTIYQRKGTIISIGATDKKEIASKILNFIINIETLKPIHIVYTELYSENQKAYFASLNKHNIINCHLSLNTNELCNLMDSCSYGIFSASNILLEGLKRCLNCAFGYYVDNQKRNYFSLLNKNVGLGLDNFDDLYVERALTVLTKNNFVNTAFIQSLSSKINNIVDFILC